MIQQRDAATYQDEADASTSIILFFNIIALEQWGLCKMGHLNTQAANRYSP